MRKSATFAAAVLTVAFAFAAGEDLTAKQPSPTKDQEATPKNYVRHTFGPTSVGRAAVGAGINQANHTPAEWKQGGAGFGRRFASSFGKHIVKKTIEFPIAKWRHEPFFYRPSDKTGVKARTMYALTAVFVTHRTTDGKPMVHSAELASAFGSGLISRAWQPASTASVADGFESGGLTLLADAGGNLLHEFWPEIRHPHSATAARAAREGKLEAKEAAVREKEAAKAAGKKGVGDATRRGICPPSAWET